MDSFHYVGEELDIFAHARNWKGYWSSQVAQSIAGDVLEVGAGIGANTAVLKASAGPVRSWTALEPDPDLAGRLEKTLSADPATAGCIPRVGTTHTFKAEPLFDSLLYIDVLEHIAEDRQELEQAAALLRPGGHIVVLAPTHQWLYTPFDEAIGHFRRYSKTTLKACGPAACQLINMRYLDSLGMLASMANHFFLHQSQPKLGQILFWDRWLVPPSRLVDRLLFHTVGKSILAIWRKP